MKSITTCRLQVLRELRRKGIRKDEKISLIYWGGLRSKVLLDTLYFVEREFPEVEIKVLMNKMSEANLLIEKYPRVKIDHVDLKIPCPSVEEFVLTLSTLKQYCISRGSSMIVTPLTLDDLSAIGLSLLLRGYFSMLKDLMSSPVAHPLSRIELRDIELISNRLGLEGEFEVLIENDPIVADAYIQVNRLKRLYSYTPLQLLKALERLSKLNLDLILLYSPSD